MIISTFFLIFSFALLSAADRGQLSASPRNEAAGDALLQSNQDPKEPKCQCNPKTAWVDMVFVVDASSYNRQLVENWQFIQKLLEDFTVQKTVQNISTNSSRVGIITYGSSATVFRELGTVDNADLASIKELPYIGDQETNLEAGLKAAYHQFVQYDRLGIMQIVVVFAPSLILAEGDEELQQVARILKGDAIVIMTYQNIPPGWTLSKELVEISSPGYFFTTDLDSTQDDVSRAICDANCFCPQTNRVPFQSSIRGFPTAGCYMNVNLQANYKLSQSKCNMFNGGSLTFVEDSVKAHFLWNITGRPFYIGLTFDVTCGEWQWPDGSSLGSYQPWKNGSVTDGSKELQCVVIDQFLEWVPTNCKAMYDYVCEAAPCDSTNFCRH